MSKLLATRIVPGVPARSTVATVCPKTTTNASAATTTRAICRCSRVHTSPGSSAVSRLVKDVYTVTARRYVSVMNVPAASVTASTALTVETASTSCVSPSTCCARRPGSARNVYSRKRAAKKAAHAMTTTQLPALPAMNEIGW